MAIRSEIALSDLSALGVDFLTRVTRLVNEATRQLAVSVLILLQLVEKTNAPAAKEVRP